MLRTDLADYRSSDEMTLRRGLQAGEPLALAEAYHRTIAAAHACARRLLTSPREVEALLRAVYGGLWQGPPDDIGLEAWVRQRTFELGSEHLRERGIAPAAASLAVALPDLPSPSTARADAAERSIAALEPEQRRALVVAHDQGIASSEQDDPDATADLEAALLELAGPSGGGGSASADACDDVPLLADWVLGLLAPKDAVAVADAVAQRPACAEVARSLRRGRRRLETLPPTPDMGQRILVTVLAESESSAMLPSALDGDAPQAATASGETAAGQDRPGSAAPASVDDTEDAEPTTVLDDSPTSAPPAEDTEQWRLSDLIGGPPTDAPPDDDLTTVLADDTEADQTPEWSDPEAGEPVIFPEVDDSAASRYMAARPPRRNRFLAALGWALVIILGAVIGVWLGIFLVNQL